MVEPVKLADEPVTRARTIAVALCAIWSRLSCWSVAAAAEQQAHKTTMRPRNLDISSATVEKHVPDRFQALIQRALKTIFGVRTLRSDTILRQGVSAWSSGTADCGQPDCWLTYLSPP